MQPLRERIAIVTGGSRGGGRGIAVELGAAGATVYVTGRTSRGASPPDYSKYLAQGHLILAAFKTDEQHWRDVPPLARTESPRYIGRAVAALAADANVQAKTGRVLLVGELAREYGFTDIDGRVIPPFEMP